MDKGSTIQELSRSLTLPRTREGLPITMEATVTMEEVPIIILAQGMGMGMEQAAIRIVPTHTRQEGPKPRYLFQVREDWTLCH